MITAPNQLWCTDLKRYFLAGDGYRCDPSTDHDAHSQFLIRCQAVARMDLAQVIAIGDVAMREFGLPERIRTGKGAQFAGVVAPLGLSKLSLGWGKLGIVHEHTQPRRPQQNRKHERMRRTLKEDIAMSTSLHCNGASSRSSVVSVLSSTHESPHEVLANETPGSIYVPSTWLLPSRVASLQSVSCSAIWHLPSRNTPNCGAMLSSQRRALWRLLR
jgi:transposase InsO family protein